MTLLREIIAIVLYVFLIVLIGRLVLDWVQVLAREWRPRGPMLVVAEGVYTVTDPALRAIRKVIPPLRLGRVQLDLAFMVLLLIVWLALTFVA